VNKGVFFSSWLHPVRSWSLRESRRGSNRADLPIRLPNQVHHGLRYIQAGPDGRLYISIGSPCNICQPEGLQGAIVSISPNGGDLRRIAWGIRNSVGFDWNGGIMYFTDNGADRMGDNTPPDELNELQPGAFYGFPYFGGRVRLRLRLPICKAMLQMLALTRT
jgi:glucose/arabinose dehydrogenase